MASKRKISELQAFEIKTADDAGIKPKAAHDLACLQVGGPLNLTYTCRDHKNHLRCNLLLLQMNQAMDRKMLTQMLCNK
jgi:hypothetical protein